MLKNLLISICFIIALPSLQAQQRTDSIPAIADLTTLRLTGDYRGIKTVDVLAILRDRYGIRFYFEPDLLPDYPIDVQFNDEIFLEAMQNLLNGTNLVAAKIMPDAAIIAPKTNLTREYSNKIVAEWEAGNLKYPERRLFKEMQLTFGNPNKVTSDKKFTFKGKVTDGITGEPVAGVIVRKLNSQSGSDTDGAGRFEFPLELGTHSIDIQFIGYQTIKLQLALYENGQANFTLDPMETSLEEVIVRAKADDIKIRSTQLGVENLTVKSIKELPTALGEADVIKALQTLPGVSTVGEGASGFNVRGGNTDQNLVLQDGAPIFNTAHALGFFSAFNPDVIGDVSLYKGSIPAQYGGRLSSVLEVRIKDGDFQNWHGAGGLGLANSRLALEGPIWRNQTSIIIGGRMSYSDWLLRLSGNEKTNTSAVSFRDFTGKITQRLGERHSLSLSGFHSNDYFRYAQDFGYEWQTELFTLSWNYLYSDKLSSTFKAISGDYKSELFEPGSAAAFKLSNGLKYYVIKENIFYQINSTTQLNAGAEWTRYEAKPETLLPYNETSSAISQSVQKDLGDESAIYANAEIKISPRWSISAGLRYAFFRQLGPRDVYLYKDNEPQTPTTTIDTVGYTQGKAVQTYDGWEPRMSLKYELSPNSSLKIGYNRLWQYIHLVSSTAAATPVDVWQVSTRYIPPQSTHSFSVGYFQNLKKNTWQLSLEVYYKQLENLITYKDLPKLLLNKQLETELISSEGKAYGLEVAARRTTGRWTGQLSYVYSRTLQRTTGVFPTELVNAGEWFPTNFDQPHQVNLNVKRQLSPITSLTLGFIYKTGRPYTLPTSNYSVGGIVVSNYSPRNEGRIPSYHRLDFTFNVDRTAVKDKGLRSSFTFSMYNLYFRKNAFSVYFKRNNFNQQQAYRFALIGTAIPAFSWNFIF